MLAPLHPIPRATTGVGALGGYTAHVGLPCAKCLGCYRIGRPLNYESLHEYPEFVVWR